MKRFLNYSTSRVEWATQLISRMCSRARECQAGRAKERESVCGREQRTQHNGSWTSHAAAGSWESARRSNRLTALVLCCSIALLPLMLRIHSRVCVCVCKTKAQHRQEQRERTCKICVSVGSISAWEISVVSEVKWRETNILGPVCHCWQLLQAIEAIKTSFNSLQRA